MECLAHTTSLSTPNLRDVPASDKPRFTVSASTSVLDSQQSPFQSPTKQRAQTDGDDSRMHLPFSSPVRVSSGKPASPKSLPRNAKAVQKEISAETMELWQDITSTSVPHLLQRRQEAGAWLEKETGRTPDLEGELGASISRFAAAFEAMSKRQEQRKRRRQKEDRLTRRNRNLGGKRGAGGFRGSVFGASQMSSPTGVCGTIRIL